MLYTIERLNSPAAYLVTFSDGDYDENQFQKYREELDAGLTSEAEPVSVIMDVLHVTATVDSLMSLTSKSMKSDIQPLQNPKCKGLVLVSNSALVSFSLDGLVKFGIASKIQAFATLEEALKHA